MNRSTIAQFFVPLNAELLFLDRSDLELCPGCHDLHVRKGERCPECVAADAKEKQK